MNIDFLSTPYDIDSAVFLNQLPIVAFKTASADIVDLPLQEFLANTGKQVLIATGMATLGEVEDAVDLYRKASNDNIALLHCVSNYPCSRESLNLRVISTLQAAFHYVVGFSDHSEGTQAAVIAVSLGARIIEKHFTLDHDLPGPDHKASATPEEFDELVNAVRYAETALGSPVKRCQDEERQMAEVSRKSVVLRQQIRAGERLTMDHLIMKRPGTGLAAKELSRIIGRIVKSELPNDHLLRWCDFE